MALAIGIVAAEQRERGPELPDADTETAALPFVHPVGIVHIHILTTGRHHVRVRPAHTTGQLGVDWSAGGRCRRAHWLLMLIGHGARLSHLITDETGGSEQAGRPGGRIRPSQVLLQSVQVRDHRVGRLAVRSV